MELGAIEGVLIGESLAWGCTGMMTAMEGNGIKMNILLYQLVTDEH